MFEVAVAVLLAAAVTAVLLPGFLRVAGQRFRGAALLALLPGFLVGAASAGNRNGRRFLEQVDIGVLVPLVLLAAVALFGERRERPEKLLFAGAALAGLAGWATGWCWGGLALPAGKVDLEIFSIPVSAGVVVVGAAAFRALGPLDELAGGLAIVCAFALTFLTQPGLDEAAATDAAALAGALLGLVGWRLWRGAPGTSGGAGSFAVGGLLALLATRCGANATGEPNPIALALVFAVPLLALALSRRGTEDEAGLLQIARARGLSHERAVAALLVATVLTGVAGVVAGRAMPGESAGDADGPPLDTITGDAD